MCPLSLDDRLFAETVSESLREIEKVRVTLDVFCAETVRDLEGVSVPRIRFSTLNVIKKFAKAMCRSFPSGEITGSVQGNGERDHGTNGLVSTDQSWQPAGRSVESSIQT